MNGPRDLPDGFDELDAAVEAIRSQSATAPSEELLASTVEALQANDISIDRPVADGFDHSADGRASRREMMFRFAKFGSLGIAATLALILFGSTLLSGLSGGSAFAQVIENIREAPGASYTLSQKLGKRPVMKTKGSFLGQIVRVQFEGKNGQDIYLSNAKTRKMLHLMPKQKIAIHGKVEGTGLIPTIRDLMADLTADQTKRVETIDEEGKKIDVFKIAKLPEFMRTEQMHDGSFRIWVDRETQLPTKVLVRATFGDDARVPIQMDFTDFEWNPEFPEGHFDMEVPEGYKIQEEEPGDTFVPLKSDK